VPRSTHDLVEWCLSQRIAVTAYGSLGSSKNRANAADAVERVAARHGVSAAQVHASP
jgi:diketogulonate reductase-like aldo/keto reductase